MIQIHGKDYTEVPERVRQFHEKYPEGMIQTQVTYEDKYVRCTANVWPDYNANTSRFFTGHAEEDRTQGKINATNATENCETSAVGRALGFLNIGIVTSIASAEEVEHAIHKQEGSTASPSAPQSTTTAKCDKCASIMVPGKGGKPYCKPCYIAYAEQKKAPALPVIQQDTMPLEDIPFL